MATIVCQGLQTCLESELNEPRTLRLKLASPKKQFSQSLDVLPLKSSNLLDYNTNQLVDVWPNTIQSNSHQLNKNPDRGGWSFFQDIFLNSTKDANGKQEEKVYVHPSMKRSSSGLSERSLQMCTENLGNETGTDMADSSIFSSVPSLDYDTPKLVDSPTSKKPKSCQLSGIKKVISRDIPPPLTTIRGSKSLQVRPHREDGRLVIEAIEAPSTRTCFEAERIDGRLKLRLVRDYIPEFEPNEGIEQEENDEEEEEEKEEFENQVDEDEADQDCCMEREVNGDKINSGAEMKFEKFRRACGCKEDKHENNGLLLNWEPFWVAT